jgi:FAD/FMN-containing dehydrogenase
MSYTVETILQRLSDQMVGNLSRPGDDQYKASTEIWSRAIEHVPVAVAYCRTAADVQAAVRAARDSGLPLSVRGGGHDWAGRALCDGIVIDMSGMKDVVYRASNQSVRVGGGATGSDVLALTDPLGMAAVVGSVGAVGMAGLTLGGGYGALIGRFGLALDNLLSAEVVLADGRIVTASAGSEPDLFWALRGGGGNFGVVTEMRHKVHSLPSVQSGMLVYPLSEAKAVLKHCAEICAIAPDELTVQVGFAPWPDGRAVIVVVPTWSGDANAGQAHLAPFLKLGTMLVGGTETISYGASVAVFDALLINGRRTFMETCWVPTLGERCIDMLVQAAETAVSPGCAVITHEFKGAASQVPVESTAFGLRRDHVVIEIVAACDHASDEAVVHMHRLWAQNTRHAFDSVALPGGYPNFLTAGDTARAAQSFGANAARLLRVKRRYDPENIFASAIPLPDRSEFGQPSALAGRR